MQPDYKEIIFMNLNAMCMIIYLHNSLEDYLHKVETSIIKFGWFGFMSNKGCQCASFNIADRSF